MENTNTASQVLEDQKQVEIAETAKVIILLQAILSANKPLYEKLDKLTLKLQSLVGAGAVVRVTLSEKQQMFIHNGEAKFIAPDQVVEVIDNFSEKNTVFRPAGVKRFEAKSISKQEYDEKLEKARKKAEKTAKKAN